ncbi:MAG TPA: LacI family DNA-binding transcriptional regulator [Microbacterium sp.]|uniref:LacI family DNA-binding transcriptional regulator n=1 Tax=Microbacterium sp. TaxID=51671 RepID=UPI002C15BD29|nr:LacI family DNA-binding transcriptional regulator [Microbacterium sp.]HWI31837.1 LacI family DNA-binding transcriptional regulator [Microbacterium sp.]
MKSETSRARRRSKEVAAAAGVSRSTISRVVNGSTAMSPSRCRSLREVATGGRP